MDISVWLEENIVLPFAKTVPNIRVKDIYAFERRYIVFSCVVIYSPSTLDDIA